MFGGSDIVFYGPEVGESLLCIFWDVSEESDVDVGVSGFVGFCDPDIGYIVVKRADIV